MSLYSDETPTQAELSYWREAAELRRRLMRPAASKPDLGIRLGHPPGVNGLQAEKNRQAAKLEALRAKTQKLAEAIKKAADKPKVAPELPLGLPNPARIGKIPPMFYERNIKRTVAQEFGIAVERIDGKERMRPILIPRHVAMSLAKELTQMSYPQIGRATGGRDHSTALWAIRRMTHRLSASVLLFQRYLKCRTKLKQEITAWRHRP